MGSECVELPPGWTFSKNGFGTPTSTTGAAAHPVFEAAAGDTVAKTGQNLRFNQALPEPHILVAGVNLNSGRGQEVKHDGA